MVRYMNTLGYSVYDNPVAAMNLYWNFDQLDHGIPLDGNSE